MRGFTSSGGSRSSLGSHSPPKKMEQAGPNGSSSPREKEPGGIARCLRAHSHLPTHLAWHRGPSVPRFLLLGDRRHPSLWWPRDRMSPIGIIALFWAMCSTAQQSLLSWAGLGQGHWPGARSQGLGQVPSLARRRGSQHLSTRAWQSWKLGALRLFLSGRVGGT